MDSRLQIVLVEDSEADAALLERCLMRAGLSCVFHRVETESALLAALRGTSPGLIISDFSLPQFDGLRALEVAKACAPDVPFIFVSGTIGEERAIDALRRGATDYVLKTSLSRLASVIERALREATLEQQRREQDLRLKRLTRSYRMLSATGSAILRLRDRGEILSELCRIAVQQGGYDRVVISLVDPDARRLRPRAWAGSDIESLRELDYALLDAQEPQGMAARAVLEGRWVVENEVGQLADELPSRDALILRGYGAVAALPLLIDGTAIGVMTLCSRQPQMFDEAELGVLLELTANLSFALQYLEQHEAVQFLSYFDSLTGLAKRALFCQRLTQILDADGAEERSRAVVVFDLQKLSVLNDTLGRYVADRLLENIAARIKSTIEDPECAAYLGGGTFAVSVPFAGSNGDTSRLLHNAAAQLFVEPYVIQGQELRPAIRSGVAFFPHDGETADVLVQRAEAALKAARQGNEKYLLYGLMPAHARTQSLALEARLTGALEREEFLLHYQPKIDLTSGQVVGLEALLRWQDAREGIVSPALFVPLLERSGAIVEVGLWVLQQALKDLAAWRRVGVEHVRVAINVSPLQLQRREFVASMLRELAGAAQADQRIDIEITETLLMQDVELSMRKLAELRAVGIGVALDDFGTGYSSLRLLGDLPIDTLKIDRSFVKSMAATANVMTLVRTVVSLAQAFGMRTVAEGVETAEQLALLKEMGCEQAQGFYFARPRPAAEIPSLLERLSPGRAPVKTEEGAPLRTVKGALQRAR